MPRSRVEPIPKDALPVWEGFYALTPRGELYRVEPERGTWMGRRLYGNRRDTGKVVVGISVKGARHWIYDVEDFARYVHGYKPWKPR